MDDIATLDEVWTTRQGGGGRTERRYIDFVIDGVALSSQLNADFISPFGWLDAGVREASIDRLLRKSPPDLPDGRTALYICPECADLGCGAVTLLVEREANRIMEGLWNSEQLRRSRAHRGLRKHRPVRLRWQAISRTL